MHSACTIIAESISLTYRADEVWEDLRQRFAQDDILRASEVMDKFNPLRRSIDKNLFYI